MKPSKEKCKTNVTKVIKIVPPDGGWGWFIVIGSFVGSLMGTFPQFAFSIIFSPILMAHGVSSTKIAWIYNVQTLIFCTNIAFVGPLCDEFGWRKIAIYGGIINFMSMFLSAFSPNPEFLFFSFSLLGGIGGSTALALSFLVVPRYFEKYRGFAVGITSISSCTSSFLAPIIANYLLENFEYRGASLILAAIILNQCVGGALYHPVEWHMKQIEIEIEPEKENVLNEEILSESKKTNLVFHQIIKPIKSVQEDYKICDMSIHLMDASLTSLKERNVNIYIGKYKNVNLGSKLLNVLKITFNNFKSLKYMRTNFVAWAYSGLMLGYINFIMWIPFVITHSGYSLEMAAWCSSLASIANLVGRIVMTLLSDRKFFNVKHGFMLGLIFIGISIFIFSLVEDIKLYLITVCFWGLGIGFALSLNSLVIIKVMGIDMLPAVIGISSFFQGFGGISIGTLTGFVRDATSTYKYAMWMLGGGVLVSFCLWLLMPFAERFDKKKYKKEEINEIN